MADYTGVINLSGLGSQDPVGSAVTIASGVFNLSGVGNFTRTNNTPSMIRGAVLFGAGTLVLTKTRQFTGSGSLVLSNFKPGPKPIGPLGGKGTLTLTPGVVSVTGDGARSIEGMNDWTARWWTSLPAAYRSADARQNPEYGGYPMAKFMYGIGAIGGTIRDMSDRLWDGTVLDPLRTEDGNLPWIAQMLGIQAEQRGINSEDLRNYIMDVVAAGLPAVGTRQSITDAAKRFLTGTRQTIVLPDPEDEFNLILLVKESDVPFADLAAYAAGVRSTGVIPAGFTITIVSAAASWDEWTAAAGATWNDLLATAATWAEADSLGITEL